MTRLKELLKILLMVDGIDSAVIVSRDGFLLEGLSNQQVDSDALGAVISNGFASAELMGRELKTGNLRQNLVEYEGGAVLTRALDDDALLSVFADHSANLGNIRYHIKKLTPDIRRALRPLPQHPFVKPHSM